MCVAWLVRLITAHRLRPTSAHMDSRSIHHQRRISRPTPYQANTYTSPYYQAPTEFSRPEYQQATPFASPTAADMQQDPSYQFRLNQGQQALERSGAARGVTNTGGNLRDILDYGQNAASQEYGNIYNRNLTNYNTNEQNRYNTYAANYGNAANAYNMNEQNRANAFGTNAGNAFQAYGANEVGRANAYGTNESARQGAYNTNEANAQTAYGMNAECSEPDELVCRTMRIMAQQDYNNQFNSWVQSYNQWRQTGADRFNEQYSDWRPP
jgi:hypothetical protein